MFKNPANFVAVFDSTIILELWEGDPLVVDKEVFFWVYVGLSAIFVATAKSLNQSYIPVLFNTAVVNRQLNQKVQEELRLGSGSSILLTINYFMMVSLLVTYLVFETYDIGVMLITGILLGAALIKWLFMWMLMFITENKAGIEEHGMNHLVYYQSAGLLLLPVVLLSHYLPEEIYSKIAAGALIFVAFTLLVREVQSIVRALRARISPLYIIFYLCTLELVPLVLIIYAFVINSAGFN